MTNSLTFRPIIRPLWGYIVALGLVGVGFLLCLIIPEVMLPRPFLAFWPVVVLAAELGGKGPGVLATVASTLCVNFIIYPYYGGMNLHEWVGMTAMGIFLVGGLAISIFIGEKLKIQSLQHLQAADIAASEARYRDLFESANVGKSVTLLTGEIEVNRAFCDMLGYAPEEMRGMTWQQLTPPEEIAPVNEQLTTLLRGEKDAVRFEKSYIHKNGTSILTDVSVVVQRDSKGKPLHFITTVVDMTERKRAENDLMASEKRYRALFENMPVGFVVFEVIQDQKGVPVDLLILAANSGFSATTGLQMQEVIGKRLTQVLPGIEHDAADWIGTYGKVALTGEPRQFEQNSERLGIDYSVTAYQSDRQQCAVTFLDITARKRIEAEARRERDFADGVLNSLPGVLYCYDEQFRFFRWNKNFERVTGYTSDEVARQSPLDYFADPDRELVAARIQQAFEKGESSVEADFVAKDGTHIPYFFTGLATTIVGCRYLVGVGLNISALKQTETALRESEERLRLAQDAAHIGTFDWDVPNNHITWSRWHEEMWGFKPGEFGGTYQVFSERVHPDDLLGINAEVARCIAVREPFERQFRVVWPDASVHWIQSRGEFIFSDDGQPLRMRGAVLEITERKQLETERQKFFLLAESSSEFIGMCDLDMNPLYVNPAGQRMVGLPDMAAACRAKVQDYFFPEDQRFIAEEYFPRVLQEGHGDVEIRLRHFQTGEPIWVLYYLFSIQDAVGTPIGWATVSRDITERRHAEATLRKSETRFRTLFEQAAVGVAEVETATGRFILINQCYCDITGYTRQEMLALDVHTIIHPDDLQADLDNKHRLVAGEIHEFTMDKRYFRKDGSIVWVSLTVSPMWSPGATPDHHIAIVEDISARKQAENALQQLNLELEQRVEQRTQELTAANTKLQELDKLKSLFIASMSHELRTPLNSIIGFTGIILQGMSGEINAEQRKQLGIVKNNARHLLALINDIIDVSKIESGAIELADEAFDLSALVHEISQALANAAAGKNITLSLQVPPVLTICSDRRRLKQILINLVDNAIKFTDDGEVALELGLHDSWIMLSVRDSGIGIDTQHQHRLFQAFSQIAPPKGQVHQGTGLGLYLSQRLAHLMGGEITLTSAMGVGSCFTLTLPYRRNPKS